MSEQTGYAIGIAHPEAFGKARQAFARKSAGKEIARSSKAKGAETRGVTPNPNPHP